MNYESLSLIFWGISIVILICGGMSVSVKSAGSKNVLLPSYLAAILFLESSSYYFAEYGSQKLNIFLFHLSGFVHFAFIALCYLFYFGHWSKLKYFTLIAIGFVLMLVGSFAYREPGAFHLYGNIFYNLAVMSFSFSYFMMLIAKGMKPRPFEFFLNAAVLLYFAYDAVISLSSNFLVNENLDLVAPFWLFRTLLLQLFYISLINFSWQIGKVPK